MLLVRPNQWPMPQETKQEHLSWCPKSEDTAEPLPQIVKLLGVGQGRCCRRPCKSSKRFSCGGKGTTAGRAPNAREKAVRGMSVGAKRECYFNDHPSRIYPLLCPHHQRYAKLLDCEDHDSYFVVLVSRDVGKAKIQCPGEGYRSRALRYSAGYLWAAFVLSVLQSTCQIGCIVQNRISLERWSFNHT